MMPAYPIFADIKTFCAAAFTKVGQCVKQTFKFSGIRAPFQVLSPTALLIASARHCLRNWPVLPAALRVSYWASLPFYTTLIIDLSHKFRIWDLTSERFALFQNLQLSFWKLRPTFNFILGNWLSMRIDISPDIQIYIAQKSYSLVSRRLGTD